jgi:hypothetical protein
MLPHERRHGLVQVLEPVLWCLAQELEHLPIDRDTE